jgi:hypothetical protein
MLTFSVFFAIVICVAALIYKSYQRKAMAVEHGIQGTPSTHQIKPMVVEFQTRGTPSTNEWKFRADDADKTFHIVNLETVSCTCEKFESRRQKFNVKEIQRLCKHLVRAHQKAGIWAEQEEIVMVLLQNGPLSGGTWCHEQLVASFGADFVQSGRTNPRRKTMSGTAC